MSDTELLHSTCRIALAAFLHDLGKFAERARIEFSGRETNIQQYCPNYKGKPSHIHAAYTAMALESLQAKNLLPIFEGSPFGVFSPDDTLINAAAMHHRPATELQKIITAADHLASGFERQNQQEYEQPPEATTHYTCRLWTLFEQVQILGESQARPNQAPAFRYRLAEMTPQSLMPIDANGYEKGTSPNDIQAARKEYRQLWENFLQALEKIPAALKNSLPLWLDTLDSLLASFWHAIPAATPWHRDQTLPDVSLYDHSRATAAFAAALWRYQLEAERDGANQSSPDILRGLCGTPYLARDDGASQSSPAILLVQADLAGIQDFIFASGGETQKAAAKILRGRSFLVSLLMECAALRILEDFSMSPTAQIYNAAGKFLLVLPNLKNAQSRLSAIQKDLDSWSYQFTAAQLSLRLSSIPASALDFTEARFAELNQQLFSKLAAGKLQAFGCCQRESFPVGLHDIFNQLQNAGKECPGCGRLAARESNYLKFCDLCESARKIGEELSQANGIAIYRGDSDNGQRLKIKPFGFSLEFGDCALLTQLNALRIWDLSVPGKLDDEIFHGFARRNINAFIPRFSPADLQEKHKYEHAGDDDEAIEKGAVKTFNHLASDSQKSTEKEKRIGLAALGVLKGDVDNLGEIIQHGLKPMSFARLAGLSRQLNNFFAVYLPALCAENFSNIYTVFAGGDDFFLIGPWPDLLQLAGRMRQAFQQYVAANPQIHFSAGYTLHKPGIPIRQLAHEAEEALAQAKAFSGGAHNSGKNAIACFDQIGHWEDFERWWKQAEDLEKLSRQNQLSSSYIYNLFHFVDMREKMKVDFRQAIWRSLFHDRTMRFVRSKEHEEQEAAFHSLASLADLIDREQGGYRVPLSIFAYRHRED